jgi:high-affinity Fe2+/Pb2+ permease
MLDILSNRLGAPLLPAVLTISAAGWLVSTGAYLYVIFGNAKRKRTAVISLIENIVIWLFLLLVLLFVYYSAGSAYTNHLSIFLQSAFMAMGFGFACVSAPLLTIRAFRQHLCRKSSLL